MNAGPLTGLRVLEFSEGIAGPLTARLLGDAGADVIKVESPIGDRLREWVPQVDGMSAVFASLNRNKRSYVMDSTAPGSPSEFAGLAELADVVVVDYPTLVQLSLQLAALTAKNPSLILCVISGWGHKGPWARRPAAELPVQLAAEATSSLGRPGEEPERLGTEHSGVSCALYAFQAITAALLVADSGGQRIDVSLFGSALHMRTALWVALSNPDEWWGFHLDSYTNPPEYFYTCKDRRALFMAQGVQDFRALLIDLRMDFAFEDPGLVELQQGGALGRHARGTRAVWDRGLSQWTYAEAAEIFKRHGAVLIPALQYGDFLVDPQIQHLGTVVDLSESGLGAIRDVAPPWHLSETPASIRRPAPHLGEHDIEVREQIVSIRQWIPRDE